MDKLYPTLQIDRNLTANRFYAVPLIGILVKLIACIPVYIELFFLGIGAFFVMIINSFYVLLSGKYWQSGYDYLLGLMRLSTKVSFYIWGLSDTYPGFDFDPRGSLKLDMACPKAPNRLFAFPILGLLVRFILLIPYFIYTQVISTGANLGVVLSFAKVLFEGKYPESTYELARDGRRLGLGSSAYLAGFSDSYPSFSISMNHRNIKIALIIAGIILTILQYAHRGTNQYRYHPTTLPTYTSQTTTPTY